MRLFPINPAVFFMLLVAIGLLFSRVGCVPVAAKTQTMRPATTVTMSTFNKPEVGEYKLAPLPAFAVKLATNLGMLWVEFALGYFLFSHGRKQWRT